MSEASQYRLIVVVAVLGLVANACSAIPGVAVVTPPAPTAVPTLEPTAVASVPAPEPTAEPMPPIEPGLAWHRVEIAGQGTSFEIPSGWLRFEPDWLWEPGEASATRLGYNSAEIPAGSEVEAVMLPAGSQMLNAQPLDLAAGRAMSYTLQVYAPGKSGGVPEQFETHVIVRDAQRRAHDVYVRAATLDELSGQDSLLWHVLDSWSLPEE